MATMGFAESCSRSLAFPKSWGITLQYELVLKPLHQSMAVDEVESVHANLFPSLECIVLFVVLESLIADLIWNDCSLFPLPCFFKLRRSR